MADENKLLRLYELMGAEVNRETGVITMSAITPRKPVEIILSVGVEELTIAADRPIAVRLEVILAPELIVDAEGQSVLEHHFSESIEVPVNQLRFLADEEES